MKKTPIIFIAFVLPILLSAAPLKLEFDNITMEQGLSQSSIFCICQDRQGFMWIGTEDGLNRFDGYEFRIFRPDPLDSNSISNNNIRGICEDPAGGLWIALRREGLDYFDFNTGNFSHYKHNPADSNSIIADDIVSMLMDNEGNLWTATHKGVDRREQGSDRFTHIPYEPQFFASIGMGAPNTIVQDLEGNIWLGLFPGGLCKYDGGKDSFVPYPLKTKAEVNKIREIVVDSRNCLWMNTERGILKLDLISQNASIFDNTTLPSADTISSISMDSKGYLWIASDGDGLYILNTANDSLAHYSLKDSKKSGLLDNYIWSLFEDRTGVMWVGTNSGISKFDPAIGKFPHFKHDPDNPKSLGHDRIRCFYEDDRGIIWIGAWGGGLNRFDPVKQEFKQYLSQPGNPNSLPHNAVRSICSDKKGVIWVGTSDGLACFNPVTERFTRAKFKTAEKRPLAVRHLLNDSKNNLWIATDQFGLFLLEAGSDSLKQIRRIPGEANSLCCDSIRYVYEDDSGKIWIGTLDGLSVYNPKDRRFTNFYPSAYKQGAVSSSNVECILQASDGIIWIGTGGGGLDRFVPQNSTFINYNEVSGLPNAVVYGILEDDKGYLWLTTNHGLCKFDPRSETFRTYTPSDGVQSLEFNGGAFYKTRDGKMYIGGISGFNAFYPKQIFDNQFPPQVAITNFGSPDHLISYSPVLTSAYNPGKDKPEYLRFTHKDKVIQFEFAALHYSHPTENRYAYMLAGFDKSWVYSNTRRYASYTSLPAGKYFFRVKASNCDGVWNDVGITIPILVTPPFYGTWWFKTIFFLIIIIGPLSFFYHYLKRAKNRSLILEKLVQVRTSELDQKNLQLAQILGERTVKLEETRDKLRTEIDGKTQILGRLDSVEKRYRFIFENAVDGILFLENEILLDCNQSVLDLFKCSKEEIIGKNVYMFSPQVQPDGTESRTKAKNLLSQAASGIPQRFEWQYITSQNEPFTTEVILHYIDLAGKSYFFAIVRDMTEWIKTENELREKEAKYRTLVESSLEGVYITQSHILKFCNQKFAEMFGFKNPEEVLGKHVRDLVADNSWNLVDEKVRARENGEVDIEHYYFTCRKADGSQFEVEVLGSRIIYEGKPAIHGVMRDVSHQRRLEEQLRQAQKMEDIGRLAGGVSHDFNNMLTTILGYCDLAKESIEADTPLNEYIEEITKGSNKAAELTKKLLAFSRRQTLNPYVLSLNDVIGDINKMLSRIIGENIKLYSLPSAEEWLVEVDPGQMEQILLNLAVNARDAMPKGGKLTIEVRNETLMQAVQTPLDNIPAGEYSTLFVFDTGMGMSEEVKQRIFEPFFTTKPEGSGTGLGLATVFGIVKQSGGFITVESEVDKGTSFTIYIPRVTNRPKHTLPREKAVPLKGGDENILVVEDDSSLREMVVKVLSKLGYNVSEALNGEDAVILCKEMEQPADLIITDVVMPGLSGVETIARIREFWPQVRVLYMSGYSDNAIFRRNLRSEKVEYLRKPFDSMTISRKIREILDRG